MGQTGDCSHQGPCPSFIDQKLGLDRSPAPHSLYNNNHHHQLQNNHPSTTLLPTMPPIIDSHIHLFPQSHLPTLAWYSPDSPLKSQHSIHEYRTATSPAPRGFVFLETDRISSPDPSNWTHVLDEVSLLTRIARGEPIPGEGHDNADRSLCLGIVPWAPVPGGSALLQRYMELVKQRTRTDEVWKKVRGVRYLVQDKPAGTMLEDGFIDGLKWLGREGLTFDLAVDARQGGLGQLREAVEMMERAHEGVDPSQRVTFIISMSTYSFCWDWLLICQIISVSPICGSLRPRWLLIRTSWNGNLWLRPWRASRIPT